MASSRKSRPSRPAVIARVAGHLDSRVGRGERLLVGLSGGVDSVVLLDILARERKRIGYRLAALHVNHGLSANAASWAAFCRALCRRLSVPLRVVKVTVARGNSVEGAARAARHAALAAQAADRIALAHNQDDQAETVLLNLLRGAGVRGLAAMQTERGRLLRPLLDTPRSEIEAYALEHGLEWIEDESNADTRYLRNFLRHEIVPRLAARVPACRAALARAARNAAEAAQLLDELARMDGGAEPELSVAALRDIPQMRAKNVLLAFLARAGVEVPGTERLEESLRQALSARADARVCIDLGGVELRRFAERLYLVRKSPVPAASFAQAWLGEAVLELPQLGGVLAMARRRGDGLSIARLRSAPVTIRARRGGERLQPERGRPRRSVKNLLQESGIPPWRRDRLPFIYSGDRLVCVPGLGVDCEFQARAGEAAVVPAWSASP